MSEFLPSDRASSWVVLAGGEWPADAAETDFVVVNSQPDEVLTAALASLVRARDELYGERPDLEAVRRDVIAAIAIVNVERWHS